MDNNTTNVSKSLIEMYINSMSNKDYLAYTIAKEHLGTSFTVEKSVGYLRWLSKQTMTNNTGQEPLHDISTVIPT
jgi:hypothetical protein